MLRVPVDRHLRVRYLRLKVGAKLGLVRGEDRATMSVIDMDPHVDVRPLVRERPDLDAPELGNEHVSVGFSGREDPLVPERLSRANGLLGVARRDRSISNPGARH